MNRFKKVKIASILGIIVNLFLLVIKVIVAIFTNSQAMLADSFNSGGDIFSSLITYIGNKISSKPRDKDHNLGHGKAEYIYALLISIIMILASFSIIKSSILSMFNNHKYIFSKWLVIVCLITIVCKLGLFIYTNKISKAENNLLMEANAKDHRNDVLITTLNLISVYLTMNNVRYIDSIVSIIIVLWIVISSIKIFIKSYDVLMDKSISDDVKNKVLEIVNSYSEIKKIQHFNSTPIGYKYQISLTIFVDGNMTTFESHKIADTLEKEIVSKIEEIYLAVIHVNPI